MRTPSFLVRLVRFETAIAIALAFTACTSLPALAQGPYRVLDTWKIGGAGGWDYLCEDPANHLLYVTHGPRVEILDTRTGKSAGAITGMKGTHGVALDTAGKLGFVSDGGSTEVLIFDRHTFETVAKVPAGTNPDGIAFEPVTQTVWAFNGRSSNVTVVDAATKTAVATIALPGKPEFPVADGKGNIYDNIESANSIVKLDAKTRTLTATWKLDKCESPSGLAIDRKHDRLFAVCDGNSMAVVDMNTGKQIATAQIGDGPDAARFSAKLQLAFSSNGDGTVSVVDTAHGFKTIQTLATKKGARTMAYEDTTDRMFFSTAEFGPKPEPTADRPRPRASILPDSFSIVVVGR
ncbi:MAG: YncE family protein [Acidobacteriota bacterium]